MTQVSELPLGVEPERELTTSRTPSPEPCGRPRSILHLDLDAFYAAVEMLEDPSLVGKPILVGGSPEGRGVVATASYAARKYGACSAMPMARAVRLCPTAVVLPPRFDLYRHYSNRVMAILHEITSSVEKISIDEAYLDLTDDVDAWDHGAEIACQLQARVREDVGLSASLGVSTNKLVAKVASDHEKPRGLTVIRPGDEAAFLAPLPVRVIWGVGPVTAEKLADLGVTTVGELAGVPQRVLVARFGDHGASMKRRAQGIDHRAVSSEHERKSVSRETTFERDLGTLPDLKRHLWRLSQSLARQLERAGVVAGTLSIKLRYADFETLTRQMSLDVPTSEEKRIYRAALVLLQQTWEQGRAVRLLGVGGDHLSPPTGQLPLL